jgi:hypothetical protein
MAYPAEQVRVGGWLIAVYKAITFYDVDDPVFDDYEATIMAAKSAEFLSSIRALGKIDNSKYEIYRKLARLKPTQGVALSAELEKLGALSIDRKRGSDAAEIIAVTADVTTKAGVLASAAQVFEVYHPTDKARARDRPRGPSTGTGPNSRRTRMRSALCWDTCRRISGFIPT